jgi:hypothetical protein
MQIALWHDALKGAQLRYLKVMNATIRRDRCLDSIWRAQPHRIDE